MCGSLTIIISADGEVDSRLPAAAEWQARGWEVTLVSTGNRSGTEGSEGAPDTILARTHGDWLLFWRGRSAPSPDLLTRLNSKEAVPIAARSPMPGGSSAFARPWAASTVAALAETCHVLVARAALAAMLAKASIAGPSPSPQTVTDLIVGLLVEGHPCQLIPCMADARTVAGSRPEGVRAAAAFRAGWRQAAWLLRYPALHRPSAPGIAAHLLACCVLAGIGTLVGRPLLLALPPLFLALTLLMSVAIRVHWSRGMALVDSAALRLFCDLPFSCGQGARALADLAPTNAVRRFDCDDRAVSPGFADLVEALWFDHLALLIAVAILAPVV